MLTLLLFAVAGCATPTRTPSPPPLRSNYDPGTVRHVVLCWLKDPGNAIHRVRLQKAAPKLEQIRGVRHVVCGTALPSQRDITDASFDVGLVITLEDADALVGYLSHPVHVTFVNEHVTPYVDRLLVYDILE